MINKLDEGNISVELWKPEPIDEIILAKDSVFECKVERYNSHPNLSEAAIFSALIEEILNLKKEVEALKNEK